MSGPRSVGAVGRRRYDAIDGYRGLFVVLVMLYHVGVTGLVGGWVGINHFFVFSGFLITRLLVKQFGRYGRIDVVDFYRRRVRRIVPAMLLLVAAVVVHTALFADPAFRRQVGGDSVATIGFFLNWRLISRDDAYFTMFGQPSPLRHAWTLSVEEQFYLVAPVLLLVICWFLRSRPARAAVAFLLAVASSVWSARLGYHGLADQARFYYGTDIRAQALLVGVAAGLLLAVDDRGREPLPLPRTATHVLAWIGFGTSLAALFVLSPTSSWVYNNGGMLLFAVAAALMGFAAIDQRDLLINRLFSWSPLVYLGRISYGLYLYHWPIHLWLTMPALPRWLAGTIQLGLAFVVATISFRYLELPIMRHGLRGVWRRRHVRRTVPVAAVIASLVGAVVLWQGGAGPAESAPSLVAAQPAYRAGTAVHRIGILGDSVGSSLMSGWRPDSYPDLRISNQTLIGCDLIDAPTWHDGSLGRPESQCASWRTSWPARMEAAGADSMILLAGAQFLTDHRVGDTVVAPGTPAMRRLIDRTLDDIRRRAHSAGIPTITVVNLTCRRIDPNQLDPSLRFFAAQGSDDAMVDWANGVLADWASAHTGARLADLHGQLCRNGFRPSVHGVQLYHDTLHFRPQAAAMIWTWLAPLARAGTHH
ncbi:acyltransferase family protein [Flexivirga lutea]